LIFKQNRKGSRDLTKIPNTDFPGNHFYWSRRYACEETQEYEAFMESERA
jgi:hypothetical protein